MQYTVKAVMPTGKKDEKYGDEYFVQFEQDARTLKISRKHEPQIGDTMDGEILTNKYGAYFKKDDVGQKPAFAPSAAPAKKTYVDNSDGQRQGMCINNASNYVNSLIFEKALTDKEWAETVISYAQALYRLGDLSKESETPSVASTASELFNQ